MASAEGLPERIGEEILACKVCFLRYEMDNLPKLLSCSHTFCQNCIVDYLKSKKVKNKTKFPCPLCRRETTVNGLEGVKELANNYTVIDLLDMVEGMPGAESGVSSVTPQRADHMQASDFNSTIQQPTPEHQETPKQEEKEKCCRCGRSKGIYEIKCEHKICKSCKKKEKKMEVVPCQICTAINAGVDLFTEQNPPPYSEQEEDRPPPYNPSDTTTASPSAPTESYQPATTPGYGTSGYPQNNVQGLSENFVTSVNVSGSTEVLNQQYTAQMPMTGAFIPAQYAVGQYPQGQYVQGSYPATVPGQYPVQGAYYQGAYPGTVALSQPMSGAPPAGYQVSAPPQTAAPPAPVHDEPPPQYQQVEARNTPSPPRNTQASHRDSRGSPPPQQLIPGAVPVFPGLTEQSAPRIPTRTAPAVPAGGAKVENRKSGDGQSNRNSSNQDTSKAQVTPPVAKRRQLPAIPAKVQSSDVEKRQSQNTSSPRNSQHANPPTRSTAQPLIQGQVPIAVPKNGPKVPPRRLLGEPQGLPFKCVKKFGRYSDIKMQSSAFEKPTRCSVSENGGNIIITDTQAMTVQIFSSEGEYVYMFKVLGIQGACMWALDKLAVATHRGVEVFNITGYQEKELPIGHVLNTVPYKHGFIAVKAKSLVFFSQSLTQIKELTKKKVKSSPFKKSVPFENIKDVAVSMSKDIVVLEGAPGEMSVIDDEGVVKMVIQPQNESCGKLVDPFAVTFDRWANVFVSDLDTRKVLRFSPNGRFSRCVLNFSLGESSTNVNDLRALGVSASGGADHLITVIGGTTSAEIRVYKLY